MVTQRRKQEIIIGEVRDGLVNETQSHTRIEVIKSKISTSKESNTTTSVEYNSKCVEYNS